MTTHLTQEPIDAGHHLVGVAGDWHGDVVWAPERVAMLAARGVGTILHVGDFGIWPGPVGKRYLRRVEQACVEHNVRLLVTPGNHEDWPRLLSRKPKARDGLGEVLWLTEHIAVLPRGHRFELRSPSGTVRSFVSLGGAPSVNFHDLSPGRDWWPEEMFTLEDAARASAAGHADVLLTHDAPGAPYQTRKVAAICERNPLGFPADALAYAAVSRNRLTAVFEEVLPDVHFHGHYHVDDVRLVEHAAGICQVVSLAGNQQAGNLACLDLDTLTAPA